MWMFMIEVNIKLVQSNIYHEKDVKYFDYIV